MNADARKGQRIILVVISGLLAQAAVGFVLPGASIKQQAIRLIIPIGMSILLWRGYSWARSYLAFGLGLGAILGALGGTIAAISVWWGFLLLLFPPLYAWGAWALWSSPAVEAYIAYREKERDPDMSFSTGDNDTT
jgi:hypothetical protein